MCIGWRRPRGRGAKEPRGKGTEAYRRARTCSAWSVEGIKKGGGAGRREVGTKDSEDNIEIRFVRFLHGERGARTLCIRIHASNPPFIGDSTTLKRSPGTRQLFLPFLDTQRTIEPPRKNTYERAEGGMEKKGKSTTIVRVRVG
jgi:hypothetical protein